MLIVNGPEEHNVSSKIFLFWPEGPPKPLILQKKSTFWNYKFIDSGLAWVFLVSSTLCSFGAQITQLPRAMLKAKAVTAVAEASSTKPISLERILDFVAAADLHRLWTIS